MDGERDQGRQARERRKRAPRPLDEAALGELALAYVARFATSRAKLVAYLTRKVRERGWDGIAAADPAGIAERLAGQGYVDDRAYAEAKAASLSRRGYGEWRVQAALTASGIGEEDRAGALQTIDGERWRAALRFAERRRIGPFASVAAEPAQREKALAAMLRAGHRFELAKLIVAAEPGQNLEVDQD